MTALQDLLARRSSSGSLEQPSAGLPADGSLQAPPSASEQPGPAEGSSSESGGSPEGAGLSGEASPKTSSRDSLAGSASVNGQSSEADTDEPYGVSQVETPSGIEIYYQAGPKRLYQIWQAGVQPDAIEVPSITEVLKCLPNDALAWWGMGVGIEGMLELYRMDPIGHTACLVDCPQEFFVQQLKQQKLTVNDNLNKASDRGNNVHKALERWAEDGTMPVPDVYPPHERGYVQGLVQFLIDSGVEPVRSELMVGSLEHGFAGRFDLDGSIPNGAQVTVKTYPKAKPVVAPLPGGVYRIDLKTSKYVYPKHLIQLCGYDGAGAECGYPGVDELAVLHVTEDGRYELVPNHPWDKKAKEYDWSTPRATFEDFLAVLEVHRALERIG